MFQATCANAHIVIRLTTKYANPSTASSCWLSSILSRDKIRRPIPYRMSITGAAWKRKTPAFGYKNLPLTKVWANGTHLRRSRAGPTSGNLARPQAARHTPYDLYSRSKLAP